MVDNATSCDTDYLVIAELGGSEKENLGEKTCLVLPSLSMNYFVARYTDNGEVSPACGNAL